MNNLAYSCLVVCLLVTIVPALPTAQPRAAAKPAAVIPKKEILTNSAIIELAQIGLGEAVITEKIRQSECSFDTSISGLKQLKAAKVSDTIIALMMNPNAKAAPPAPIPAPAPAPVPVAAAKPASPAPAVTPNNNSALRDSEGKPVPLPPDKGAYLWDGKQLLLLTQSQVPSMGANVGRAALSAVVPFVKNKLELQLIGTNAKASFAHSQPIILVSGMGDVIPGVPSYRLLYVKQGGMRKDRRILGTYDIGGFGSIAMVENEIPCEIKKVTEGIYAIKPAKPLPDGEYGLVPITRLADVQANSKSIAAPPVWDFGIYAEGNAK